MKKESFFFHYLDLLRFVAFLLVFISHSRIHVESSFWNFIRPKFGVIGVKLFFVISGFLITTIMLREKELTKTISLSRFYKRRILRIFPLYFGTLVLILLLSMYFGLTENGICDFFRYYFSFLGNFDRIVNNKDTINSFIGSGVLWSIGIEEQFYLL